MRPLSDDFMIGNGFPDKLDCRDVSKLLPRWCQTRTVLGSDGSRLRRSRSTHVPRTTVLECMRIDMDCAALCFPVLPRSPSLRCDGGWALGSDPGEPCSWLGVSNVHVASHLGITPVLL
jgi:hypothetical protein